MTQEAPVRSREEDAKLRRSNKKVKEVHSSNNSTRAKDGRNSYKERLNGVILGAYEEAISVENGMETEAKSDDKSSDLAAGIVAVNLSGARKTGIRVQWTNALIVKVVGKTVGNQFLSSRIMSLWKPVGRLVCVDLKKDFFLVRFSLKDDYVRVLKDGPWFIGGYYLSIRKWEPNFKPTMASVSSIAV